MYTLKIEGVDKDFLRAAQAFIQEKRLWSYEFEVDSCTANVILSTMSIRELKHLVDMLESEEFMRDSDS
jgi:hypothetical protein